MSQSNRKYSFYPTLLNDFHYFQVDKMRRDGVTPYVSKQNLIDKLNKKPYAQSEAMLMGIAFENCLRQEGKSQDGVFDFDADLLESMREFTRGGTWQTFLMTTIMVDGIAVKLYGYSDVIRRNIETDVKTTGQYQFPAYIDLYQHHVYLLGANDMGFHVDRHDYLVSDFKDYYLETYPFDPDHSRLKLQMICRDLIEFCDNNRDQITNPKIFGEDSYHPKA